MTEYEEVHAHIGWETLETAVCHTEEERWFEIYKIALNNGSSHPERYADKAILSYNERYAKQEDKDNDIL